MKYLALCLALTGCCAGHDPSQVAPAAPASFQATAPATKFGVTQDVKSALMLPPDVVACLGNGATAVIGDVIGTLRCVFEKLTPPVVVPIQTAPAAAPKAAPCAPVYRAPAAKECAANGTCPR